MANPLHLLLISATIICLVSAAKAVQHSYEVEDINSENGLVRLFDRWLGRHGKLYGNHEEKARRLQIFRTNLQYIHAHNKNSNSSFRLGLNKFADLTNEEFKTRYFGKNSKQWRDRRRTELEGAELRPVLKQTVGSQSSSCSIASSLDWRKKGAVTGVKDQAQCGSCWAFSTTGAIEGVNFISTGKLVSLSEQELVDCDATNYGCEGGDMDYAFTWVIQNGGIDTEKDYSYTGVDSTCNTNKEAKKIVSIDGYTDVSPDDSALLCAAGSQPVSVGIDGSAIDFQLYIGGIYDGDCSGNPDDIDHAVLVVGYSAKNGKDYWIVKNSWGTDWGLDGYFYILRNTELPYGVCAINAMASYPTKTESSVQSK